MSDRPIGSSFKKAFWLTALPLSAFGLISTAGGFELLWFLGAGGVVLALGSSLGLTIARQGQAAGGVFAGVAVAVLALGVTCFINLTY